MLKCVRNVNYNFPIVRCCYDVYAIVQSLEDEDLHAVDNVIGLRAVDNVTGLRAQEPGRVAQSKRV